MLTWSFIDSLADELVGTDAKARNTRRMWRARGRVPARFHAPMMELAGRRGVTIKASDFLHIDAPPGPAPEGEAA